MNLFYMYNDQPITTNYARWPAGSLDQIEFQMIDVFSELLLLYSKIKAH